MGLHVKNAIIEIIDNISMLKCSTCECKGYYLQGVRYLSAIKVAARRQGYQLWPKREEAVVSIVSGRDVFVLEAATIPRASNKRPQLLPCVAR